MNNPTIIIDDIKHEIKKVTGKDWRILGEFLDKKVTFTDKIFLEEHAEFIANFFDGVTADDVLNLPLEEILPVAMEIRNFMINKISEKLSAIEKNAEKGEEEKITQ